MSLDHDAIKAVAASIAEEWAAEDLLTVKEYAERKRVHVQTVYSAIRRGLMKLRVERPTPGTIRIAVPRESIQARKCAE